jgi:Arc/MetJ-type ribon-helix-helix transcriptional regulator
MSTQVALRLDPEQLRELDRIVITWDDLVNRSDAVRLAIAEFIERRRQLEIDRQIVDAYTRIPQSGPGDIDEWGDLGVQMDRAGREMAASLDREDGGWDAAW